MEVARSCEAVVGENDGDEGNEVDVEEIQRINNTAVRGKLGSVLLAPIACNTRWYRRTSPVTPGVTGAVRL